MNDGRKHRAVECGAGGSKYVHSEQRRNFQSKPFHEFTLLPPRPRSYGDTGSELLGLQVQGLCCPLRQRPSSGRVTQRATPQSREVVGGGSLTLSSLRGRLESREKPASRPSTGSGPEMNPEGGLPVSETAETPMTACDNKRHGHPDAAKVSELHLYLPSSLCDDEEQDADRGDEPHERTCYGGHRKEYRQLVRSTKEKVTLRQGVKCKCAGRVYRTSAEETKALRNQRSNQKPSGVSQSFTHQSRPSQPGTPQHTV